MNANLISVISIGIVSYMCFTNRYLFNKLHFSPYVILREKQWYRFLTSAWVHGDFMHLFVNLFVLYSFGNFLELVFSSWFGNGILQYLLLFVGSVIIAHIPTYLKEKDSYNYSSVGASGGVSGVLFASILIQPLQPLYLFAIIPIPGIMFGVLYMFYTHRMAAKSSDNINHEAHMFGALGGMLILVVLRPTVIPAFISQLMSLVG
mgnify:CR=1 FL=1